uniref:Uncharacterized protein n=1 Tax=Klebsiella pneumoniae TaxID=573 RepID=A0A7T8TJ02_KLEPN|nr:hypothetical protein JJQ54_00515 [Klebsiella pneumoniae]
MRLTNVSICWLSTKKGNLVIIENKLDDSGRDVVWQALKYAGYCANLRQESVVEIFFSFILHNMNPRKSALRQKLLQNLWAGKV